MDGESCLNNVTKKESFNHSPGTSFLTEVSSASQGDALSYKDS